MAPSQAPSPVMQRVKRSLSGLLLALFAAWLVCSAVRNDGEKSAVQPRTAGERTYDKFRAGNVSLLEYDQNGLMIRLSIEEIIHRKRKTPFFEYQNLKELRLHSAVFDIYLSDSASSAEKCGIPFHLLERCIHLLPGVEKARPIASYLEENTDGETDILSRIQFDRLAVKIHYSTGTVLELAAEKAFLGGDFKSLVLEGNVKILTPKGQAVRAQQAVITRKFDGILFPGGHFLQKTFEKQKSFYRLSADGRLTRLQPPPDVRYADPLAAKEQELYDRIFKKLPPHQRIMFGITGPE